jgi:FMN phosphatase YigB (HAD superfamily)
MSRPTTFGLFGTLVSVDPRVDRPREPPVDPDWNPAAAVAAELAARGVRVPEDWTAAYAERHLDPPALAGVPLPAHVAAALRSRGVEYADNAVRRAVVAAFDPEVTPREGALAAVEAAADRGPVGVLTNCVVPELAGRTLLRAGLRDAVDATVTAAGCGWRKPHEAAFEVVAERLGAAPAELLHVGGTDADAGVARVGGRFVDTRETSLPAVARALAEGERPPTEGDRDHPGY